MGRGQPLTPDVAQDQKPRGLIPLVPDTFTASIERVAPDAQKGTSLKSALVIRIAEKGALDNVTATYQLADENDTELKGAHAAPAVGGTLALAG